MTTVNRCDQEKSHCYDLDIEKVRDYLFAIERKISDYNQSQICLSDWGYGCRPVTKDTFERLMIFKGYLNRYFDGLRFNFDPEMKPDEVQSVLEASSKLINLDMRGDLFNVTVDDSQYETWILNNPTCVALEDWEKLAIAVCPTVGIEIVNVSTSCDFVFDIVSKSVQDCSKFLHTLSVINVAKDQDCFDVSYEAKKLDQCKLDYDIISKKKACNFNFETYAKLLECNLSSETVGSLLDCGVTVDYNAEVKCPILTVGGNQYNLDDLKVNVLKCQETDLQKIGVTPEEFDYLINSYKNLQA